MDTVKMRELIERIISDYAKLKYAHGDIERLEVFDRDHDRYLLMISGRENGRRVHGCIIHVDIINGKFWIRRDGLEQGVATDLLEAGVPKDQIVLAFKSPQMRALTEFAVA